MYSVRVYSMPCTGHLLSFNNHICFCEAASALYRPGRHMGCGKDEVTCPRSHGEAQRSQPLARAVCPWCLAPAVTLCPSRVPSSVGLAGR